VIIWIEYDPRDGGWFVGLKEDEYDQADFIACFTKFGAMRKARRIRKRCDSQEKRKIYIT
jgi:hypothetical protein